MLDHVICNREQFSFRMCLESGDCSGTFRNWTQRVIFIISNSIIITLTRLSYVASGSSSHAITSGAILHHKTTNNDTFTSTHNHTFCHCQCCYYYYCCYCDYAVLLLSLFTQSILQITQYTRSGWIPTGVK